MLSRFEQGWTRQWQETLALRGELQSVQRDISELAPLQAENQRLRRRQIPPAELESLRADHAALLRMRAELDALKFL